MVLVARFPWAHKDTATAQDKKQHFIQDQMDGQQQSKPLQQTKHKRLSSHFSADHSLLKIFTPNRDRGHAVPTLSGIIKAGDEAVYTSTLFHSLHGHPGQISLELLLEAFATELRSRPLKERSAYSSDVSKFLANTRRDTITHKRVPSFRTTTTSPQDATQKPQRKSFDLERGLGRSMSRRVTPVLVPTANSVSSEDAQSGSWMKDIQRGELFEGKIGVKVTPSELAALSVILGSTVNTEQNKSGNGDDSSVDLSKMNRGAFGISIHAAKTEDGSYNISLKQHKLKVAQYPSRGSGFSTVYAKHIASGSLPVSQDKNTVSSLLLTPDTVEAFKSGTSLQLQKSTSQTLGAKFLATLPNTRSTTLHTLAPSPQSTSDRTLLHTIADLPFVGGLVPLASAPIIQTVQFAASGGLPPARLLQRLDGLVDKVHRQAPHLQLFGPLFDDTNAGRRFREHDRLGKLATDAALTEPVAYKTARMHRYVTLLERLMSLVPDMKPAEVLAAVREATKREMERAYDTAVSTHSTTAPISQLPSAEIRPAKRHSSATTTASKHSQQTRSDRSSNASSISNPTVTSPLNNTSPRTSSTFPILNSGKLVENVLKSSLPLDIGTIALVARMVIVAWTMSVETVAWEEGEEGFRVPDLEGMAGKMNLW